MFNNSRDLVASQDLIKHCGRTKGRGAVNSTRLPAPSTIIVGIFDITRPRDNVETNTAIRTYSYCDKQQSQKNGFRRVRRKVNQNPQVCVCVGGGWVGWGG